MRRCFTTGLWRPSARPTACQWIDALERAERTLASCTRSPHHLKPRRLGRCPWCARADGGVKDPFPGHDGIGLGPRAIPAWRAWVRRVPPPPARVVVAGAAGIAGAVAPIVVPIAILLASARANIVHAAARITMAIPLGVAAAFLVPAATPLVVGGRLSALIGCSWVTWDRAPMPGWLRSRRWQASAAVLIAGLACTQSAGYWWPVRA
jgi:DNA-binding helix-hairpin-helix protein with protein kinase domain